MMPYHKNKQQAFQAAQQGMKQLNDVYSQLVRDSDDYGQQLKHVKNEVNETYQQIENAMEVASETQRQQLEKFRSDIEQIVNDVNND
jgi:methyl-accepting chemotaxis protein